MINLEADYSKVSPDVILNQLMEDYATDLKRIAFLYVNDMSECEDNIQEVFISLLPSPFTKLSKEAFMLVLSSVSFSATVAESNWGSLLKFRVSNNGMLRMVNKTIVEAKTV